MMQRRMQGYLQTLRVENVGLAQSETPRRFFFSSSLSPNPVPLAGEEGDRGRGSLSCSRMAAARWCLSGTSLSLWSQVTQSMTSLCTAWSDHRLGGAGWQHHAGQDPTGGHSGTVAQNPMVWYDPASEFDAVKELDTGMTADVGGVVLADEPYAGEKGGRAGLTLPPAGVALLDRVRARRRALVVTFIACQLLIVTDKLPRREASVNLGCWVLGNNGRSGNDVDTWRAGYPTMRRQPFMCV